MDDKRFGLLTKAIQNEATVRRGAVKGVLGAALGLSLGKLALGDVEAKKKKKKCPKCPTCKDCPTCPPACKSCTEDNEPNGCCEIECCLKIGEDDGGDTFCRGTDQLCCSADEGGGACSREAPFCCPPTPEEPDGFCSSTAAGCEDDPLRAVGRGGNGRAPRIGRNR